MFGFKEIIFLFPTITQFIFPVFWLADTGSAGPSSIAELKEDLYDKVETIKKYLIIFTAIFIAGWVVPAIYLFIDLVSILGKQNFKSLHLIVRQIKT